MVSAKAKALLNMCCMKIFQLKFSLMVLGNFIKNYVEVIEKLLVYRGSYAELFLKDTLFHSVLFIFPIVIVPASFIASLITLIRASSEVTQPNKFDTMTFLFDVVGMIMYLTVGAIAVNYWVSNETPFSITFIGIVSFITSLMFFIECSILLMQKFHK